MTPVAKKIFFLCLFMFQLPLWGQSLSGSNPPDSLEKNLYESALLQVEYFLLNPTPEDSLIFELLADAKSFAAAGQWQYGLEILQAIPGLYSQEAAGLEINDEMVDKPEHEERFVTGDGRAMTLFANPRSIPRFQIEAGVDYSQQEFELSFDHSDSTIIEELQNPYISFAYSQPFYFGRQLLQLNHRIRLDNQFLNYAFFGSLERQSPQRVSRLQVDGHYFLSQSSGESNFLDGRALLFWGNPHDMKNRWYVELRSRFKWYPEPDSLGSDILTAGLNAYYEYFFNSRSSFYFNWVPSLYRSSQNLTYRYFQSRLAGKYRFRGGYNRFLEIGGETVYQVFESVINESFYRNRYMSFQPCINAEWPVNAWLGFEGIIIAERRIFADADEIYPNYFHTQFTAMPKYYWAELSSVGIGYYWEQQIHDVPGEDLRPLAAQANFFAHGLLADLEVLRLNGMLLNFTYQLSWRNYPDADETLLSGFYSDRLIHSLSVIVWIPLFTQLDLQAFANYDNDRDRILEHNDTRNTIVNLGIIYKW